MSHGLLQKEQHQIILTWEQEGANPSICPFPDDTTDIYVVCLSLTRLPPLPPNLRYLSCDGNALTELPPLPSSLEYLACLGNQLTSLPELPETLTFLDCGSNPLQSLPKLPSRLEYLACNRTPLKRLPPPLPSSLLHLHICHTEITGLPSPVEGLRTFSCSNIVVFPPMPLLSEFCFLHKEISIPVKRCNHFGIGDYRWFHDCQKAVQRVQSAVISYYTKQMCETIKEELLIQTRNHSMKSGTNSSYPSGTDVSADRMSRAQSPTRSSCWPR